MRVLLTSDFLAPLIGGAERQVELLAAALADAGHGVWLLTTAQPGIPERDELRGVPVERLASVAGAIPAPGGGRRFVPPAPDPLLALGIRRAIDVWRPDVVHASGWIGYATAAAARSRSVPMVLSVRDYGHGCATRTLLWHDREACDGPSLARCLDCAGRRYGAARALVAVGGVRTGRHLLRRAVHGIHSVSRFVERTVRRDVVADDPLWEPVLERIDDIVPDGPERSVDTGVIADPVPPGLPDGPFILFVGALTRHKGLGVLVRAWRAMPVDGRPPLVCIGTRWPETPAIDEPGIHILSEVPHAQVMGAWSRCLFGVVPSIWADPLPGTVREPMTRGRPVIGSDIGGIPDMIRDGENGLLVPPGDVSALTAAMARLVEDGSLRERLGAAGAASVVTLTPAGIAARFEALYDRVLAGDGSVA